MIGSKHGDQGRFWGTVRVTALIPSLGPHENSAIHTTEPSDIAGRSSIRIGDLDSINVGRRYDAHWSHHPQSSTHSRVEHVRLLNAIETEPIPSFWLS
jgi:hypothetical protein